MIGSALASWFGRTFRPNGQKSATLDITQLMGSWYRRTKSGEPMSEEAALQVTTVLACVSRVADDVAALPLEVFRRVEQGADVRATNLPEFALLSRAPNVWQTHFEFVWMMTARAMLAGEALALKEKVGSRVDQLIPLRREQWTVEQLPDYGLRYKITSPGGGTMAVGPDQVLHLRRRPWNGYSGLRAWHKAREAIGLAAAAEGGQAKVFGNGSRPSGILTTDQPLGEEALARIAEEWRAATTGDAMFGVPVLDHGLKFLPMSLSAVDAQAVETRKHQIIEICSALGVLPAVLGVDDKTQAFASVEAMMRAHLQHTIAPWLRCWTEAIDRDVLDGGGPIYARFDTTQMTMASTKDQADADRVLVEAGLRTPNEIRARDGYPAIPGGDQARQPMNMGIQGDGR